MSTEKRRGTRVRSRGQMDWSTVPIRTRHSASMNGEMVRKWLRLERRERGWNQDDLAEAAGIKSRTTIRKLESGLKLSEGVEGAVEQALGWELGDLDRIRSGGQPTRSDAAGSKDLARMTYEEILSAAMGVEKTRGEVAAQRVLVAWVVARDEMLKERGRVDEPPPRSE